MFKNQVLKKEPNEKDSVIFYIVCEGIPKSFREKLELEANAKNQKYEERERRNPKESYEYEDYDNIVYDLCEKYWRKCFQECNNSYCNELSNKYDFSENEDLKIFDYNIIELKTNANQYKIRSAPSTQSYDKLFIYINVSAISNSNSSNDYDLEWKFSKFL